MKTLLRLALATTLALVAAPALAQTVGGSFNVTANVTRTCTFQTAAVGDLAFGTYDPYATTDLDASTSFSFRCNNRVAVQVQLGYTTNATGTQRRMAGGISDFLNYDLYQDASRTTPWGNILSGAGANTWNYTMTNGSGYTKSIYGRIPALQDVSPGTYADNGVTITVNY